MKRVALFNDTSLTQKRHYGCNLVMRNLVSALAAHGMQTVFSWPVGVDWRVNRDYLPEPGSIDGIIVNGEGSIHHSATRRSAAALVELAELAEETYGVPAFLINATLFENTPALYERVSSFDQVFVRDEISRDEARQHGVDVTVCPDATLGIASRGKTSGRRAVGVTDSCFRDLSRQMRAAAKRAGHDFIPMEQRTLNKFLGWLGPDGASFRDDRFNGAEKSRHVRFEPDFLLFWLRQKQAVVTGRYHTVAMSLLTETPLVALESNTPKISSLLETALGNSERVMATLEEALDFAGSTAVSYSETELHAIRRFKQAAEKSFQNMMQSIGNRLGTENCDKSGDGGPNG